MATTDCPHCGAELSLEELTGMLRRADPAIWQGLIDLLDEALVLGRAASIMRKRRGADGKGRKRQPVCCIRCRQLFPRVNDFRAHTCPGRKPQGRKRRHPPVDAAYG